MFQKGRNRDTAWYSITEQEWPAVKSAFEGWLPPDNFDASGDQTSRLQELMAKSRVLRYSGRFILSRIGP